MLTRLLSEAEKERGLRAGTELAAQAVWATAHEVASLLVSRPGFGRDEQTRPQIAHRMAAAKLGRMEKFSAARVPEEYAPR